MKRITILIPIIFFAISASFGQTKKAFLTAAENSFATKDYYSALVYYSNALEFDTDDLPVVYKTAEAARLFNAYALAEQYYQQIIDNESDNEYPLAAYHLADMKQRLGKYDEAIQWYDMYLSEHSGEDEFLTAKAEKEKKASSWANELLQTPNEGVEVERRGTEINTAYSEIGGLLRDDTLYYSSLRFDRKDPGSKPSRHISKILKAEGDNGGEMLSEEINQANLHTAHTAFSLDKSKMYFTICDYSTNVNIKCDLYVSKVKGNGMYGEPEKLPNFINDSTYTSTQPSIGFDTETNKEILYFVSDRPGGEGGLDIWYSIIDGVSGTYTRPMNLGQINTPEDDLSPFYHIPTNTLYFASSGYQGLGGYDIYSAIKLNGHYDEVVHLGTPVNSSFHDVYFSMADNGEDAVFSSNREGALYLDESKEACCFDIYDANFKDVIINLNAMTYNKVNQDDLISATVSIYDDNTGELLESLINEEGIDHKFKLSRGKNYTIIAQKDGFFPDTIRLSTAKFYSSQDLTKKMYLQPAILNLDLFTFDRASMEALKGVTIRLKDLSSDTLYEKVDINKLANDFHYMVNAAHEYEIVASKFGYKMVIMNLDPSSERIEGTTITKKIYMELNFIGKLNVDLPLALYFDNDRPDPRTISTKTNKNYSGSFDRYYGRKNYFISRYTANLSGEEKVQKTDAMNAFFEEDLKGGFEQFQAFLDVLLQVLQNGQELELQIKGYASPVAPSTYNLYLGQRRVSSIRNEMDRYKDGAIKKFIESGQLVVTDISYGETLAPQNVSDAANNKRLSVYSVEASKERRVEIVQVLRLATEKK